MKRNIITVYLHDHSSRWLEYRDIMHTTCSLSIDTTVIRSTCTPATVQSSFFRPRRSASNDAELQHQLEQQRQRSCCLTLQSLFSSRTIDIKEPDRTLHFVLGCSDRSITRQLCCNSSDYPEWSLEYNVLSEL